MTSMKFRKHAAIAAFIPAMLYLSSAVAQTEGSSSNTASSAQFRAPLVDRANETAKALAASENISVGEATKRLRMMRQAANASSRAWSSGQDPLIRPMIKDGRVRVYRDKGRPNFDTDAILSEFDTDLRPLVDFAEIARPIGEMKAEIARLSRKLTQADAVAGLRIDVVNGTIGLLSTDPALTNKAVKAQGLTLPGFVQIETSEPIQLTDTGMAGMTAGLQASSTSCRGATWGFMAYQNGDILKPGLLTVAHVTRDNAITQLRLGQTSAASSCGTGTSWQTRRLDWRGGAYTDRLGIDIAFHNQTSGTTYSPYFFDGAVNSKVLDVMFPAVGTKVCKFGVRTQKTCGTVEADLVWSNGYGYMTSVIVDAAYPLASDVGDSGGPVWFSTNSAVGVEHAKWGANKFLYSELQALVQHGTGLTIATTR